MIGFDSVELKRIEKASTKKGFLEKIYSKAEIEYIEFLKDKRKIEVLSGRFAVKESVFKCICQIEEKNIDLKFREIETRYIENTKIPYVYFLNEKYKKYNGKIKISISHDETKAYCVSIFMEEKWKK